MGDSLSHLDDLLRKHSFCVDSIFDTQGGVGCHTEENGHRGIFASHSKCKFCFNEKHELSSVFSYFSPRKREARQNF